MVPPLPWVSAVFSTRHGATLPSPQSLHCGYALIPDLCKFIGVGSVSYSDSSRKHIHKSSNFHRSVHVIFLLGSLHLVQAPWDVLFFVLPPPVLPPGSWLSSLWCLPFPIVENGKLDPFSLCMAF